MHTYGPHYFRCNDENVWVFVNRFTRFYKYEAVVNSYVDGEYENWPIAASYIQRVAGDVGAPQDDARERHHGDRVADVRSNVFRRRRHYFFARKSRVKSATRS